MTQLLTNSRMAAYRKCPKYHEWRYEVGIVPEQDSLALRVGTAFHAALEAADIGEDPEAAIRSKGDLEPHDEAMVAAMFTVHQEVYAEAEKDIEVIEAELSFNLPLVNPDTGGTTPVWRVAGKIDRIYRRRSTGAVFLKDYKTTTEDMSPGSEFWLRLSLDQQLSIYVIAARSLGYDVQHIMYDVTARPMHRPSKATPPEAIKLKKDGTPYANTRLQDETPEEFAARVADAMRADPVRFFARHEIARTDQDLDETVYEVWYQQLAIREAQRSKRWFRNPSACVTPYRCPYLSFCKQSVEQVRSSVPDGFRILADVHPELASAEQAAQTPGAQ